MNARGIDLIPFFDILERLESEGFSNIKISTIRGIILFYEVGSLLASEYRAILNISQPYSNSQLQNLMNIGILERFGSGSKIDAYQYKLKKEIRQIIEGTYEKRNDCQAA